MVIPVLIALGILAYVRVNFPSYFPLLKNGVLNYRIARQEIRESPVLGRRGLVWMIPFAIIFWSIFLMCIFTMFSAEAQSVSNYLEVVMIVTGMYTAKVLTIRLLEGLFGAEYGLEEYVFNIIYFLELVALLCMPFLVLLIFGPSSWNLPILWFIGGAWMLTYVYRLFRGIVGAVQHRASLVYIILYLCALEILPLLVLFKLVMSRLA